MDTAPHTSPASPPNVNPQPVQGDLLAVLPDSPLKPGFRTSELWLTVLLILVLNWESWIGALPASWAASLSVVLGVAYKITRAWLKITQAGLAPALLDTVALPETPEAAAAPSAGQGKWGASLLLLAAIPAFLLLPGCASMTPETRAKWTATGQVAGRKAFHLATSIVLDAAVSSLDREHKLDYIQGLSTALRSRQGDLLTADDVRELVRIWTPNQPHWDELAAGLARAYSGTAPQTPEEARAVLESMAQAMAAAL